tara:strand:- start:310 stop:621 length:312 start_codon:yes stop_codon:yes gene_type:complete
MLLGAAATVGAAVRDRVSAAATVGAAVRDRVSAASAVFSWAAFTVAFANSETLAASSNFAMVLLARFDINPSIILSALFLSLMGAKASLSFALALARACLFLV